MIKLLFLRMIVKNYLKKMMRNIILKNDNIKLSLKDNEILF